MSEKEIKTINELPLCDQKAREEISKLSEDKANGVTTDHANTLWALIQKMAFTEQVTEQELEAFKTAWGIESSGEPDEPIIPDEPDTPTVTLSSISATYNGEDVLVGTELTDLVSNIVVTAKYSDGTSKQVTGYELSGEIVEGSNSITVTYQGKTTTFVIVGITESGGDDVAPIYTLETVSNASLPDRDGTKPIEYSVSNGNHVEISIGDDPSFALYMDANFSSATTNGVELSKAPEWFKIPAGATVTFKLTNVSTTLTQLVNFPTNMHFGLRETGASKTGMAYVLEVKANENLKTGLQYTLNETWEKTTTIENETSISGVCGDISIGSLKGTNFQFDVELYVNGERWI